MFVNCPSCHGLVATDPATDLPPERCPRCAAQMRNLAAVAEPASDARSGVAAAVAEAVGDVDAGGAADPADDRAAQPAISIANLLQADARTGSAPASGSAPLPSTTPAQAARPADAVVVEAGPSALPDGGQEAGESSATAVETPAPGAEFAPSPSPSPAPAPKPEPEPESKSESESNPAATPTPAADTDPDPASESAPATAPAPSPAPPPAAVRPRRAAPSFARTRRAADDATPGTRRWPLPAAIAGLGLLLGLQWLLADRERLAADPTWRPLVTTVCGVLRCSLPPWHEPAAFALLERDVRPHPQAGNALRITASFRNDAAWAQAWPEVVLTLSDLDGRPLGARAFTPVEYLGSAPTTALVGPGEGAVIRMDVLEPGSGAVGFSFDFR